MALVRVMSRETCRSNRSSSRPLTMAEKVQVQNPTRPPYILMATIHRPIGSKNRTPLLYNTLGEVRNTEAGKSAVTQKHDGLRGATQVCQHVGNNPIYIEEWFSLHWQNGEVSRKQATQWDMVKLKHNNKIGMGRSQRPPILRTCCFLSSYTYKTSNLWEHLPSNSAYIIFIAENS